MRATGHGGVVRKPAEKELAGDLGARVPRVTMGFDLGLDATVDRVVTRVIGMPRQRKCRLGHQRRWHRGPRGRMAFCASANYARTREVVQGADYLFRRRHTSQPGAIAAEECAEPGQARVLWGG